MFGELDKCLQEIKPDVCDPFDLISDDEEQEIENTLRQLEKETTRVNFNAAKSFVGKLYSYD